MRFSDFRDQDLDAYSFRRVEVDVQQFVPLPDRYRTLALRAGAIFTDPAAGNDVPFYPSADARRRPDAARVPRVPVPRSQQPVMTAEYRWEAWWTLDGALFVDAGTVGHTRRDLSCAIST